MQNKVCECGGKIEFYGSKGDWHPLDYYRCVDCLAQQRHRLLLRELKKEINFEKVLHISPDLSIDRFLKEVSKEYITGDFPPRETGGVVMSQENIDLRKTRFEDNYFDIIIASHVIDQIKEEEEAIKELHRILKGKLYLIVPIYENELSKEVKSPMLNHWRRCGPDYFDRYKELFNVEIIKDEEWLAIMTKK